MTADSKRRSLDGEVYALVAAGVPDEEVLARLIVTYPADQRTYTARRIRDAISKAHDRIDGAPVSYRVPWLVSYIRPDGQKVYRVGGGHDVPEGSLAALGFRL